ncbi:hypothetical protein GA0061096_2746 [Fictibacillus enclensis]|nr:hypothetical protein GA0061096_2746 [Fictibacillus enclensis]
MSRRRRRSDSSSRNRRRSSSSTARFEFEIESSSSSSRTSSSQVEGTQNRRRNRNRRQVQIVQCNCGGSRPSNENPVMGAMNQRPTQVTQNCNCGGSRPTNEYPVMGAMNESPNRRPSCRRFCENVCRSQFGSRRRQCIQDCLACRGNTMGEMDDNDCNWRSPGPRGDVMGVQSDMYDGHYWDSDY